MVEILIFKMRYVSSQYYFQILAVRKRTQGIQLLITFLKFEITNVTRYYLRTRTWLLTIAAIR